ncbi:uncharacterized protein LOC127876725 [Dreissena polymorpha]|uniref:uncharacterized protein LOC127876725 n=1 Tax=Dreissena polymorpha TaxID=45954 RepID=UPI002263C3A2|nr:uncharacterized protein LOC127876725 [Dreissena polymorpha]
MKKLFYEYVVVLCGLFSYQGLNAAPLTTEQYRYDDSFSSSDVSSKTSERVTESTTMAQTTTSLSLTINTSQLSGVFLSIERLQMRVDEQLNKLTLGSNVTRQNIYTLEVQQQRPVLTPESTEHARQCETQTLLVSIRKMYYEFEPWCIEMESFIPEKIVRNYLYQTLDTLDSLRSNAAPVTTERASFDVSSSSSDVTSQKTEWSTVSTAPNQNGPTITVTTAHLSGVFLAIARLQKKVEEQFNKQV